MRRYLATFPAGTYEIIVKHLKSFRVDEVKLAEHDESSVLFDSALSVERLIEIRYFTNIYLVIKNTGDLPLKGEYFRLMLLKDGGPEPLATAERAELEARIKRDFGLRPNTHQARNDFYVIERTSGQKLFTLKLPRAKFKREKLQAGELKPELAHILCLAAGLKAKHAVLDLFAGYGAIPLEAVRGFGCKDVGAVDTQVLAGRCEHPSIRWHQGNAGELSFVADASVDRVVTDPPWGAYAAGADDLAPLYAGLATELQRALKPDSVAVVLSGYDQADQHLLQTGLRLIAKWNVLVSGKKAVIYKLQKAR